ncbi:MAG TPA: 3-oxoacyl-ACP synthase III family protein [Bacteroidales bacterium]|nr:3-oxoacyl-ACP synthase III family protein [Bacteroidales bacterium]
MVSTRRYSVIKGTGTYIPEVIIKNDFFLDYRFFGKDGRPVMKSNAEIIEKFKEITEIEERRYAEPQHNTSDLGYFSALEAIEDAGIDPENLDYIIVAHNFGDVYHGNSAVDMMPTIAARIKKKLGIKNPNTIAYDLPFGCPGWVQAMIHADYFLKSGDANLALVIGAETLSRISDPHDIDSMIYSDGAGATILQAEESSEPVGIIAHKTRSDTIEHCKLLWMDKSNNPEYQTNELFIKMLGHKVYEYAITYVPILVKECIEKAGVGIRDIKKILVHQANGKMDSVILQKTLKKFGLNDTPEHIMPMIISRLGNNSVATVPVLLDFVRKNKMENHAISPGEHMVFASVGAGMNINAIVYKVPE